MSVNRREKLQEALREVAAEFLAREASRQSLITVTRTEVSEKGSRGIIFISVLPVEQEGTALAFANRHLAELATYFEKRIRGARAPHVEFMLDKGEKNRQRLDELTK